MQFRALIIASRYTYRDRNGHRRRRLRSRAGEDDRADAIGTLWLNGLRMTIVPLIVSLLVTGINQTAGAALAGRIAARSILWIVALMTLSAITGAILTPLFLSMFPMPIASAAALKAALGGAGRRPDGG